jgi:DNA-binding MarR family transcriptional regulator
MEQQGLVTRVKGKEDSRQRIVCLTDKGKALEEQAKVIPECLASKICEQGIDTQEITQTIPALDKLIEGLKQTENRNKSIK